MNCCWSSNCSNKYRFLILLLHGKFDTQRILHRYSYIPRTYHHLFTITGCYGRSCAINLCLSSFWLIISLCSQSLKWNKIVLTNVPIRKRKTKNTTQWIRTVPNSNLKVNKYPQTHIYMTAYVPTMIHTLQWSCVLQLHSVKIIPSIRGSSVVDRGFEPR